MCESNAQAQSKMMMGNAAIGAYGQYVSGKVNAQNAMTKANFEVAQLESMGILASAKKFRAESQLRSQAASSIQDNIAAAMFSGLDMASFDSIDKGMKKDMTGALSDLDANYRVELLNYKNQSAMAMLGGQMNAAAARLAGNLGAANTLVEGAQTYSDTYHHDKSTAMKPKDWREKTLKGYKESFSNFKSFFTGRTS